MPIDTLHPQYEAQADTWKTMRDVVAGDKAVKKATERYLPKLSGHDGKDGDTDYKNYLNRATFFNATGRVVDALTGMVFRKDPEIKAPVSLSDIREDITLTGKSFNQLAEQVVEDVMGVNRVGVLVDFPNAENLRGKIITVPRAQELGLRVYAALYRAEDIINWRTSKVGGKTVLSLLVLRECVYEPSPKDPYVLETKVQYRELALLDGDYKQTLWQPSNGKDGTRVWTKVSEVWPLVNGKKLNEIPFEMFSDLGNDADISDPQLYDLGQLNLAHYRNTADMEHGLHFTGLPTPWIAGVTNSEDTYRIGSGMAWLFSDPATKVEYLEFKGEGLKQLRQAIRDKEEQMAALGARMLTPEKKDAEAAETISQKRQGETSSLAAMANAVSRGLTRVLKLMAMWQGSDGEISVKLNTDFNPANLSPQAITALVQAVMTGNLSSQSFYEAMLRGEVVSGARTFEEEQALIDEDHAKRTALTDDPEREPRREAA